MLIGLRLNRGGKGNSTTDVVSDNFAIVFNKQYSELFFDDWYDLCEVLLSLAITNFDISMRACWGMWITNYDAEFRLYIDNFGEYRRYILVQK